MLIFMVFTSHRVHSLFMLRLFNDPVAMLFLYGSLVAFTGRKWTTGSVLFSYVTIVCRFLSDLDHKYPLPLLA